jgi:hypothetical protein
MLIFTIMTGETANNVSDASASEILDHLDLILRSPAFLSSKRSQEFLRFVVGEKVEGRADSLKERTIAVEVFGKGSHFEPGEDSLVRVKAREVRKRLAEYYELAPDSTIRIDIPLGGYVPRIQLSAKLVMAVPDPSEETENPVEPMPHGRKHADRRKFLWMAGGLAGTLGAVPLALSFRPKPTPLDLLWRPVFATKSPLLIFVPILTSDGQVTDRVGLGPSVAVIHAAEFLTKQHYPYRLRFGTDLTFPQLREQPSLLLGGPSSSQWTSQMVRGLRFDFVLDPHPGTGEGVYVSDTQTKRKWGPIKTHNGYSDQDYAVLCRLFDSSNGQIVFVAAGITTFGTESAAEFLFDPSLFSQLMNDAPDGWESKNFQAVIHLSVIGTAPSSPRLIATHFW